MNLNQTKNKKKTTKSTNKHLRQLRKNMNNTEIRKKNRRRRYLDVKSKLLISNDVILACIFICRYPFLFFFI